MNELLKEFFDFLNEEYMYLSQVKLFLNEIPLRIENGNIDELEFQGFLEKYEVQNSHFIYEKNRYKERISEKLHIKNEHFSFRLLVHIGHREFHELGQKVFKISNEISMQLLKIAIFLKNDQKMQREFKRLNSFLYQHDYSPMGIAVESVYRPGRNFYGEA